MSAALKTTKGSAAGDHKLNSVVLLALLLACLVQTAAAGWSPQHSNGGANSYKQQIAENEGDDLAEDFSQIAESLAGSVAAAAAASSPANSQCEPISIGLCTSMPYNFTRVPNFFGDSSQIEAAERAGQYELLARSTCSRHLMAYLCELLAPMCIENDLQNKFEIYPCKSYCRQVKRDCENQILDMAARFKLGRVPPAFDCDSLRFEANGGDGPHRGPCHEMRDEGPAAQGGAPSKVAPSKTAPQGANNNYRPYQKDLDMNVPPFITDNSPIDKRIIRPSSPTGAPTRPAGATDSNQPPVQPQPAWSFGHQLATSLSSYSNLLSVLTLICLLLVVNAKRLKRLKSHLTRRSSSSNRSSSSSSASSNDSRRKLAGASVPALGQARKLALSPSSSSRSLVLVTTDGKRGQPKHKLIRASELGDSNSLEPSQKLLHVGLDRRTLINVNGTLERQKQQQNSARYHLMQSNNHQHQLAHQRHQSEDDINKHQYDYIQVGRLPGGGQSNFRPAMAAPQRLPPVGEPAQLCSNILLSSPSHQVLLFGDGASSNSGNNNTGNGKGNGNSHQFNRAPFMSATHGVGLGSPYADPSFPAGALGRPALQLMPPNTDAGSLQQHQHQQQLLAAERQRSFQRRPSNSQSSSSSRQPFHRTSGPLLAGGANAYASSSVSSSASSSAGSTSSSFSPPESSSVNPLLANQLVQASSRTGRGV